MSEGRFFTFPLCVLAKPFDPKERLQHACSHAMCRAGQGARAADKRTRAKKQTS